MTEILHHPTGQGHPYVQGPEERSPREPLAGQGFTVGVCVRPPGAIQQVHIHVQIDDQPEQIIPAVHDQDWRPPLPEGVGADLLERYDLTEQDVWQVELTAPAIGHTLTYWFEADGQLGERWTVVPAAWQVDGDPVLRSAAAADGPLHVTVAPGQAGGEAAALPDAFPALKRVEWLTDGQAARRVRLTFAASADEAFYGLGERFNALNQRGNVMDIRVYEQYRSQGKRAYMPIPFMLSSAGYGLHVASTRWMQFDLAASQPDEWTLEAEVGPDQTLDLNWFSGADPYAIVGQFARFSGPPALPPLWSFGLWMSSNEWNNQARVEHEVAQAAAHAIDPAVVVIEAWSDEHTFYIWNDAQYTPVPGDQALRSADFTYPADGLWPDPKGMTDRLHAQDIRLVLWQIPVVKLAKAPHAQHDADRAYYEQAGFGVKMPDGSPYHLRPFWFQGSYVFDVTNAAERAWWFKKRAYLLEEFGVDGFKTDGGEHLWGKEMCFSDGRTNAEVWNEYPKLYTQAYYDFACSKRGGDAVGFSRAGYTGSQASPIHWAGDEASTWDAYRASILAGLSAGVSGIPFWSWDIAGFSGDIPTAELYLRSTAMAAFCPVMQYHSEYNPNPALNRDRSPWNIQDRTGDARIIPVFRFFLNARHNLMPYIWQEAQHSAASGEPLMRALAVYEPEASPYHYFFGRDLLVCPVVDEGATSVTVALPAGDWYDLWTGERFSGGQTVTVPAPLDRLPVFVRAGAVLPVNLPEGGQLGDYVPLSPDATTTLTFGA